MAINMDAAINYLYKLQAAGVTYSMDGSRTGADGTADCSGAVYAALRTAGASNAGYVLNTESLHAWLLANGFVKVAENTDWDAQHGDVFIWGQMGASAGAGGHTGIFIDHTNIIHCNYAHNGVSVNNHDAYWVADGRPYFYAYRYAGTREQAATDYNVVTALGGYNSVWSDGYQHQSSHNKFTYQSNWKSLGILPINGLPYYNLGGDEWFPQYGTTLSGICQINYTPGYGVLAINKDGKTIADSNTKFLTGTRWKCNKYLTDIKGQWCYTVATNIYIPTKYAVGCGQVYH